MQVQQGFIDLLLHLQGNLHGVSGAFPLDLRFWQTAERYFATTHILVFYKFLCMFSFLIGGFLKEFPQTRQSNVIPIEIGRNGQVSMGCFQFCINLTIDCRLGFSAVILFAQGHFQSNGESVRAWVRGKKSSDRLRLRRRRRHLEGQGQ